MNAKALQALAAEVLSAARAQGVMLATAESCTGGLVAGALTAIGGSSDAFERGFVTYSNAAKHEMLGVPQALIAAHGAVSAEVAGAMAVGALKHARAHLAVAITGVAGPGGGSALKPIGLVHFAVAAADGRVNRVEMHFGDIGRDKVRAKAVETALKLLLEMLAGSARQMA